MKKHLSMTLSNIEYTKTFDYFLVENIMETHCESKDKKPPCHSEAENFKYLQQTFNSINYSLLSLVISYVGSQFKLLRMSLYKNMKQF